MKTPRLALLALLALAPAANAEMPAWTVVDESFRSWPTIDFKVGSEPKSLRCRLSECDPSKKKGQSNLFVLTQTGALEPIDATVYKMVPRSKYNPRYYTDGPYEKVPEIVKSHRTRYTTTLSNFKLDNSGAALVVVQGTNKYPATTDINRVYVSATGSVIAVAPPTTMADDVVKPGEPATAPRRGGPRRNAPLAWWCNPATGVKVQRRAVLSGWTKLASAGSECKKQAGPATTPVVAGEAVLMITDRERNWLTKKQAKELDLDLKDALAKPAAARGAAQKSAIEKHRALIKAQIRPESAAGYAAAIAAPKTAKEVDDALPAKLWGGDVASVVASSGTNLEIQLSPEEYAALKNKPDDLRLYEAARVGADGNNGEGAFDKGNYDPIQLHLAVEAARKALGTGAGTGTGLNTNPAGPALDMVNLIPEQRSLLTPDELNKYQKQVENAERSDASKETKEALYKMNAEYKDLIKSRKPYVQPANAAAFGKMEDWQKKRFCAGLPAPSAVIATDQSTELKGTGQGGRADLGANDPGKQNPQTTPAAASAAGWSKDEQDAACKKFKEQIALTPQPNGGTGRGNQRAVVPGPDANPKEKEPNTWITRPLLQTGAKGALIGILIGSLFGPVGLIAGPLIGAAFFYGLKKYDDAKAKKAE